jgi:hypothetical protein
MSKTLYNQKRICGSAILLDHAGAEMVKLAAKSLAFEAMRAAGDVLEDFSCRLMS